MPTQQDTGENGNDPTAPDLVGWGVRYVKELGRGIARALRGGDGSAASRLAHGVTPEQVEAGRKRIAAAQPKPPAAQPTRTPPAAENSAYRRQAVGEPSRQSGRKAAKKTRKERDREILEQMAAQGIWPYTLFSDKYTTTTKVVQSLAEAGRIFAMSGGTYRNLPPTPRMGGRASQRGFVRTMPVELDPEVLVPSTTPATPKPVRRPGTITPHTPPVTMPGGQPASPKAQPRPTAPDTRTQEYLDAIQHVEPIYPGTDTKPVHPGPGPTTTAPSPTRVPGTTAPSTSKPGKTGSGTPVAKPRVGSIVLSADALLDYTLRELTRRSPGARSASSGIGPTLAPTGPGTVPAFEYPTLTQFAPGYADQDQDVCSCDKKRKERKPRKRRTECWKGSYTETATGLRKSRREQVPC